MERSFIPVSIALLTISDTRMKEDDKSGNLLESKVLESGHILFDRKIVKDDISEIKKTSISWIQNPEVEIIISTGGTGLTGRDVSPEAFRQIFDKEIEVVSRTATKRVNIDSMTLLLQKKFVTCPHTKKSASVVDRK